MAVRKRRSVNRVSCKLNETNIVSGPLFRNIWVESAICCRIGDSFVSFSCYLDACALKAGRNNIFSCSNIKKLDLMWGKYMKIISPMLIYYSRRVNKAESIDISVWRKHNFNGSTYAFFRVHHSKRTFKNTVWYNRECEIQDGGRKTRSIGISASRWDINDFLRF